MAENHNHNLEALPPERNGKQEQENEKLEGEEIEKRVSDSPPVTESHPPESRSSDAGTLVVPSSLVRDHGAGALRFNQFPFSFPFFFPVPLLLLLLFFNLFFFCEVSE